MSAEPMTYTLTRLGTGLGVGWFSCVPRADITPEAALRYLKEHPNDSFMHQYFLDTAREMEPENLRNLMRRGLEGDDHLLALTYETCLLNTRFSDLIDAFDRVDPHHIQDKTPLIYISWNHYLGNEAHFYWLREFSRNINLHKPLLPPEKAQYPIPYDLEDINKWRRAISSAEKVATDFSRPQGRPVQTVLRKKAGTLIKNLESRGILAGWESRTEATLSPFAVERPWNLDITVKEGKNHWKLQGTPTSYGRGLTIHQARISCAMEAVERISAFASISRGRVRGRREKQPLIKAKHSELSKGGEKALDPGGLCLETPYHDQELCWVRGERVERDGRHPVLVPAQMVYLFCNLDEINLTSGISSNGLAAADTLEQAKLHGLLEVIERDADKVVPYTENRCFIIEADDPKVREILSDSKNKGISIQFLDITSELGIPCYRAFVQGPGGAILKGTAADLDGKAAVVSALTEIPYPYPYWFGSMPAKDDLDAVSFESLPNYSSGSPKEDLHFLESLLLENKYHPIYVDLTREDLDIPVVKAIVPGLEIMTIFDRFTHLGLRQFGHYMEIFRK